MARDKRALRLKQQKHRQQQLQSMAGEARLASRWPVTGCLMSDNWQTPGALVQIVVTRTQRPENPASPVGVAVYLVDLGCLGVKNTYAYVMTPQRRREMIAKIDQSSPVSEVEPGLAVACLREAIAYARALGFAPHPDFRKTEPMLTGIEPGPIPPQLQLGGPDGKPLYVAGPHDDPQRIVRQLEARVGRDGFHYVVGL